MKTYNVNISFNGFFGVIVEAKTEKEARDKIEKEFGRLFTDNEEMGIRFETISPRFYNQDVCLHNGQIDDIFLEK